MVTPRGAGIHTALTGEGNADSLPFFGVLQFHFGDAKEQAGDQLKSICCVIEIISTSRLHQSAKMLIPSLRLRARRLSFQTTTVSISPLKMAACSC